MQGACLRLGLTTERRSVWSDPPRPHPIIPWSLYEFSPYPDITVAGVVVHQDAAGRYSLNDLHKAAGGDAAFKPANFLRLDFVDGLVEAIVNCSDVSNINPVDSRAGRNGGTFVCKELVYAYANWISPAFYLNLFGCMIILLREVAIIYRWEV